MKKTCVYVCLFLWFCLTATITFAAQINNIRLAKYQPNIVRLVVETDTKPNTKIFELKKPNRLVIDFKGSSFSKSAPEKVSAVDFVNSLRRGVPDKQTARLVLELPTSAKENHFTLRPSKNTGWRFVMDIKNTATASAKTDSSTSSPKSSVQNISSPAKQNISSPAKKSTVPIPKPISALKPAPIPNPGVTVFKKKAKKIIVLDPGHGGKDPGAISRSGKYEKHITLAMAKETQEYLEDAGYKVVLTRSGDKAIPLRRRYEIAHEADGDLFISIHADSAKNKSARGLSVYTISEKASDKEAAALAERENKADILLGLDLSDYNPDVSNILIDLAKIDTMNKSAVYAKHLVKEMKKETTLVPNAHRFAGFAVLKSANIPSILLELGYLSNPREDKLLQKKAYRRKLARALVRAINQYFETQN